MAMGENSPVCLQERERSRDWLTAFAPILVMGFFYYRWWVLALALTGTAAYMAVAALIDRRELVLRQIEPALVTGLLVTFCLPATAPLWTVAIACAVAALLTVGVDYAGRRYGLATAPVCPALVGYLLVRLVFPGSVSVFTMPVQWASVDTVAGATPLAALTGDAPREMLGRLFTGIYPATIGEGCAVVILLAAGYLILRRRLRLIAPAVMLAVVSGLSWLIWDAPLYSLLCGGTMLAALVMADRAYVPASWVAQVLCGVAAGGVLVLLRAVSGGDGATVGVLVSCLLGCLWSVIAPRLAVKKEADAENFAKTEKKG